MNGIRQSWLKLFVALLLLVGLPVFIWAVATQRIELRKKASDLPIASVRINPEIIAVPMGGGQVNLSALGYDTNMSPLWANIMYQWGMSSVTSVGTFTQNGNLATFYPSRTNTGTGDIWVRATGPGGVTALRSIPVYVGVSPPPVTTPSPNPSPTPSPPHYCAEANGSPCTTGWFTMREDCQQDSLYLACPSYSQQAHGVCQNNTCVFPTPPPFLSQCTYSQTPCNGCDALLACPPSTPTPTPSPSPTPASSQKLEIWVRLAGVTGGQAAGAKLTSVKFYLKNGTIWGITTPLPLTFQSGTTSGGGSGVYSTLVDITNPIAAGTQFRLSVKGEKHGAVKFCKSAEQYGPCGDNEYITMPNTTGTYRVYLTGIPLPAGDLNQDGAIKLEDVNIVTEIFKKPSSQVTAADKLKADVNYDGYVDNFDLGLILQSLATRYDE